MFEQYNVQETLEKLNTDERRGLSDAEAARRLVDRLLSATDVVCIGANKFNLVISAPRLAVGVYVFICSSQFAFVM